MPEHPTLQRTTVELVTPDGEPVRPCDVLDAHRTPGLLHRAFSVFLFDGAGRTLLQRRADHKSRFAGLWSNSCCSHPAPGDDLEESAAARLVDELGLARVRLTEAGRFTYQAGDPASELAEYEYDHVLVGRVDGARPEPDPGEVAEWRWVDPAALRRELAERPEAFTPWLGRALDVAEPALARLT